MDEIKQSTFDYYQKRSRVPSLDLTRVDSIPRRRVAGPCTFLFAGTSNYLNQSNSRPIH